MDQTLYVTDLDGTLLRNDATLSGFTMDAVRAFVDAGYLFTYATARSYTSASVVAKDLTIALPVITFNGNFIVDAKTGDPLHGCYLDKASVLPLLHALLSQHAYPLVYASIDGRERVSWLAGHETEGVKRYLKNRPDDLRLRPVAHPDALMDGDPFYLTFIDSQGPIKALEPLCAGFPAFRAHKLEDSYAPGEFWLEISSCEAGKDAAVCRLREMIGAKRVVCFGDNLNDMPMFEVSDAGYAVENAQPALKEMATGIIAANENDGVAHYLRSIMGL